ncbi:MAG: hypothetical protein ACTHLN_07495 [Tepidisphaeraceae bacterium]
MAQARRKRDGRKRGLAMWEEAALDRRRRVKGLLAKLGLLGLFEKVPANIRDQLIDGCCPDPQLVFDPSFPTAEAFGGAYAAVRETVREGFARATVPLNEFDLAVKDWWAIALPLANMTRRTLAQINSPLRRDPPIPATFRNFLERATPLLDYVRRDEMRDATYAALHEAVIVPLVARSRMDTRLLHGRLTHVATPRGGRLAMTLYSEQPAMKYVRFQGNSRPMHRVGTSNTWNGIEWASWSRAGLKGHWADEIGIEAGTEWPVFVQSHALKQMRARLDVYAHADWAEHWMYESLKKPKIVSRLPSGQLLVAFEVQEQRLGYLVVTAWDGIVAVRTFLFLTMAQTPEGRLLEKKLQLTRAELDYLRLHELSRFTQTDLKDDPDLRDLLCECGCGHLFEMAEDEDAFLPSAQGPTPFAEELKQYVGLAA